VIGDPTDMIKAEKKVRDTSLNHDFPSGRGMESYLPVLKVSRELHILCTRTLAETDPQKVAVLLTKIDEILAETLSDVSAMLKDVEEVLRKRERSSRIHLA
jgi:hypothetical protein